MSEERMWGGRFAEPPNEVLLRVNASIHVDRRLVREDVLGSIAHARMLRSSNLLEPAAAQKLEQGLVRVLERFLAGEVPIRPELEDIHTHVEDALRVEAGEELAGRLHAARSRNDQIVLDEVLWLRSTVGGLRQRLLDTIATLAEQARSHANTLVAGVTHLQPAQPVTVGHQLLAHTFPLLRDEERLADLRARIRFCPLGSGSLATSPLPIDREEVAVLLGFEGGPSPNSMDAVADRDLLVEFCQVASLTGVHLSRLAEDLILWSTPAFGFVELPDACCTGSSLMPQKKNPDALELVRGKSGRLIAASVQMLTLLKGLPMAYNKDLQEDKEAVFDAADNLADALDLVHMTVHGMHINVDRCAASVHTDPTLLATDLADYLVEQGVPFREAHRVVGALVRQSEASGLALNQLPYEDMKAAHSAFEPDISQWLDPSLATARRDRLGGPAPKAVRAQVQSLRRILRRRADAIRRSHADPPLLAELQAAGRWPGG